MNLPLHEMHNIKKYLISLTLFSLAVGAFIYFLGNKFMISNLIWFAWIYFIALSIVSHIIASSGIHRENKIFVKRMYGSIGIRFIFSIFPLIIYLLFSNIKDIPLVIAYVLLYFFYTFFEIYHLVVNLRPGLKRN